MTTETEAEQALWTIRRGDDWRRTWTLTAGDVDDYDGATLLAQLRRGPQEFDPLIASSNIDDVPGEDEDNPVALVDLSDTDLEAVTPVLSWHVDNVDTEGEQFTPGSDYWFEIQCEIDGDVTTFLRHRVTVEGQVAVDSGGS